MSRQITIYCWFPGSEQIIIENFGRNYINVDVKKYIDTSLIYHRFEYDKYIISGEDEEINRVINWIENSDLQIDVLENGEFKIIESE